MNPRISKKNLDVKKQIRALQGKDNPPVRRDDHSFDLNDSRLYLNREITWLNFNRRVLYEAENSRNPLLERLKFISITSSNTDQFFMKRIGGLKLLVEADVKNVSVDGRTPQQQIDDCYRVIHEIEALKSETCSKLLRSLKNHGIRILAYSELDERGKEWLRDVFTREIYPLMIPQGVDPAHPFPFISNLSLNLLVTIRHRDHGENSLARVKVPVGEDLRRFIQVEDRLDFVLAEEVIKENIHILLPDVDIVSVKLFRATRNANTEKDEEQADDLLELIESEIRERRFAPVVRLQVEPGMDEDTLHMICKDLELGDSDVFEINGMVGKSDLMELALLHIPRLRYTPYYAIDPPRLKGHANFFHSLRTHGDILVFHPYESFTSSVERFLREASEDPKVRAIKMTLYRTSGESKVIDYLLQAVRNGKQVAVVIELKARFDEQANIQWAERLEEEGIHVTYGVIGFKTHVKMILVTRRDYNGFRTYCHIGTGNYHAGNARDYTDLGLFTAEESITRDMTEIFNFLTTGYSPKRKVNRVLMAPNNMKKELIAKIERETRNQENGDRGHIQMKMNALEDSSVIKALYKASRAGVKIDLVIRDTCRLRPGIPGLSETIRVRSIIGRYLEHYRCYYFRNGGEEEYYIGSADAMKRNLEHRIEVIVPVLEEVLQRELRTILDLQLSDYCRRWEMHSDGSYELITRHQGKSTFDYQVVLAKAAYRRQKESEKLKKVESKGKSKKEYWHAQVHFPV